MKQTIILLLAVSLASSIFAGPPENAKMMAKPEKNARSLLDGRFIFDFQERLRFEHRDNNFDFNDGVDSLTDDAWLLQRARLGAKVTPADWLSFYVQGQSSFELDSDRPNTPGLLAAEGDDPIDLRQAWIKLGSKELNLTLGRQILSYGDERLLGSFDWNNIGRTFDAAKFHYESASSSVDVFVSSVVVPDKDEFNQSDLFDGNDTGRDQIFSGIYFSTRLIPVQVTDLYAFELHEEHETADTDFVTLGSRIKADPAKLGGFDYETEMAVQFGEVKDKDLAAFAGHWGVGYVMLEAAWKPRIGVEYNFATGDENAKDGDVGTFQNLFPTNHKFYGYMDLFSWQNLHNPAVSFSVQPTKALKLQLDYHAFFLAGTSDAWYRANGTSQVRPITSHADGFVGTELDFTVSWKPTAHLALLAGYSHFFTGNHARATGAADDADFAYVQATFDF